MNQTKKLLVIEDDLNLTLALYSALSHTYKVVTAKTAESGLNKIKTIPFDLIILDLNLPDINGLKVTRQIRELGLNLPILILSGETGLISKVDLLDNGANDYVTKPFSLAELRARIRVLLRQPILPSNSLLKIGGLVLDPRTRSVIIGNRHIDLRKKEYALLECLMMNAGTALSRNYLQQYVWGNKKEVKNNSIDVHIKSLRDKLQAEQIKTVHGLGYMYESARTEERV